MEKKPTKEIYKLSNDYNNGDRSPEAKAAAAAIYHYKYTTNPEYKVKQIAKAAFGAAKAQAKKYGCVIATDRNELSRMKELYLQVARLNQRDGKRIWSVDHTVELALGGPHIFANLQCMKRSDNLGKSNRLNPRVKKGTKRKSKSTTTTEPTPELWEVHKTLLETRGYN